MNKNFRLLQCKLQATDATSTRIEYLIAANTHVHSTRQFHCQINRLWRFKITLRAAHSCACSWIYLLHCKNIFIVMRCVALAIQCSCWMGKKTAKFWWQLEINYLDVSRNSHRRESIEQIKIINIIVIACGNVCQKTLFWIYHFGLCFSIYSEAHGSIHLSFWENLQNLLQVQIN